MLPARERRWVVYSALRRGGAALLAIVAFAAVSFARDGVPASRTLEFDIVRADSAIGHHHIRFGEETGRLTVDIDVAVKVNVLFVTVYRFTHRAREVWEGGRLVAMTARTEDDGTPHALDMALRDGMFAVTHNGAASQVPAGLVPTSLWNPATVKQTVLFGSLRGDGLPTTVTPLGGSAIDTPTGPVMADGYLIDARPDFKRRVWYDASGRLVAVKLEGRDGSEITYRLR
jgi:hypothetical protein